QRLVRAAAHGVADVIEEASSVESPHQAVPLQPAPGACLLWRARVCGPAQVGMQVEHSPSEFGGDAQGGGNGEFVLWLGTSPSRLVRSSAGGTSGSGFVVLSACRCRCAGW